jgi:tetratricopeptide (TPR) repeat protein
MLPVLVVLLAVVGVYMQALGGPFLWDDRLLVIDAPLVEQGAALGDYLRHPFWTSVGARHESLSYYRPLVTLSFALDHRLHGSNPGGYHLTNLVLHLACALLLLAQLRRVGVRPAVATLLTVTWALLPRLAEAAAWISGRTDVLATAFVLAALLAWSPALPRRWLAAGLFTLGLFAKESALALLPALALFEWVEAAPAPRSERLRQVARRLAPLAVTAALYLALRLSFVGYRDEATSLGGAKRALVALQALGTYALMLGDAWRPRAVIGRIGALSPLSCGAGACVLVVSAVLLRRFGSRLRASTVIGLSLFVFALAPVLHVVPIPLRTLAADRFLYLPIAGLVLALAPAFDAWLGSARLRWAGSILLALSLAATTFRRVGVWSDELEFWSVTYLETPRTNNAAATELFGVYYRAALYEDALELAERAIAYDDPFKRDARHNAALCLSRLGRREEARALFVSTLGRHRSNADVEVLLAVLAIQAGEGASTKPDLERLARGGDPAAGWLLRRLPELMAARAELTRLGSAGDPEQRARVATFLGDDRAAIQAWREVAAGGRASRETLHESLSYLVRTGDPSAIAGAARAYTARFGALDPELAGIVEVRLTELERLLGARARLGLGRAPRTASVAPS